MPPAPGPPRPAPWGSPSPGPHPAPAPPAPAPPPAVSTWASAAAASTQTGETQPTGATTQPEPTDPALEWAIAGSIVLSLPANWLKDFTMLSFLSLFGILTILLICAVVGFDVLKNQANI